jgi:hypothetical protein
MNADLLYEKLQASERKRAQLLVEVGHLRTEMSLMNEESRRSTSRGGSPLQRGSQSLPFSAQRKNGVSPRSSDSERDYGSPQMRGPPTAEVNTLRSELRRAEHERATAIRDLANLRASLQDATAAAGTIDVQVVDEPTDVDFAFAEEEEARAAAEEILAQLLHSRRALNESREEVAALRLSLVEATAGSDAIRARELSLTQMVDSYRQQLVTLQREKEKAETELSQLLQHPSSSSLLASPTTPQNVRPDSSRSGAISSRTGELLARLQELEDEVAAEKVLRRRVEEERDELKAVLASQSSPDFNDGKGSGIMHREQLAQLREENKRLQDVALSQMDCIRQRDDFVKRLQLALREKMSRLEELETLLKAQRHVLLY